MVKLVRGSFRGAFAAAGGIMWLACTAPSTTETSGGDDHTQPQSTSAPATAIAASACVACVNDSDCGSANAYCAQFDSDSFCAIDCGAGGTCTSSGSTCEHLTTAHGEERDLCVPTGDPCGPPSSGTGARLGAPATGVGVTGSVSASGGSVSNLFFGIVGDTRPPVINDTRGYPTTTINDIFTKMNGLASPPTFAVSSGDYIFSSSNGGQSSPQFDLYLAARHKFTGQWFPAMGNHECTGATTSNCGTGNADGLTKNYQDFLAKVIAPLGQTKPYYAINIKATDNTWTSKFVFIAANAWDAAQDAWLRTTMAQPTTYTFVIRHEPSAASTAPGVKPSERIMAMHPYTLAIVGHTHTYKRTGTREVTIGNGGAPLTGSSQYGFGLAQRRPDGAIQIDMVDLATGREDTAFRFAVKADGSAAP